MNLRKKEDKTEVLSSEGNNTVSSSSRYYDNQDDYGILNNTPPGAYDANNINLANGGGRYGYYDSAMGSNARNMENYNNPYSTTPQGYNGSNVYESGGYPKDSYVTDSSRYYNQGYNPNYAKENSFKQNGADSVNSMNQGYIDTSYGYGRNSDANRYTSQNAAKYRSGGYNADNRFSTGRGNSNPYDSVGNMDNLTYNSYYGSTPNQYEGYPNNRNNYLKDRMAFDERREYAGAKKRDTDDGFVDVNIGDTLEKPKTKEPEKNTFKDVLNLFFYLGFVLLAAWALTTFVIQRTEVSGSSMENTLFNNDSVMMDKISYRFKSPQRFDIIVFNFINKTNEGVLEQTEEDETHFVKRIIGCPGETVRIDADGVIYINGNPLEEHFGKETIRNPGRAIDEITLGADEYFVLGDNRNSSTDSRENVVGNITKDQIIGKALVVIFPFDHFKFISNQ